MSEFHRQLQRVYNQGRDRLMAISTRWDLHANRRTLIISVVAGTLAALLYLFVIRPPNTFPINELVSVESGKSLNSLAAGLHDTGVVRSPLMLRILITLMGHQRSVHAGDYLFKEPLDVFSVARALSVGTFGLEPVRIRVPEGATVKEMATIFSHSLLRFNADTFLAKAQSQEGYLFPDTYNFLPNANEQMVIDALRQDFDSKIATTVPPVASSTHSLADIVTMASILEREAYNTEDRRLIAGVLWNRIARGMALQVDATFAYTIGKGTFQLTMKDLTSDSPYNTYKYKGLPPTPIGSPSLDSIQAALKPTKSDYLYFLADRQGVTHYCKTYSCQLANKARYF